MAAQALREEYNGRYRAGYGQPAIRQPERKPEPKPQLDVVRPGKPSKKQRVKQEFEVSLLCARRIAAGLIIFSLAVCNVLAYVANDNAYRSIQDRQHQLELKQSEYAKYSAQLSAMVSADKVERIAVEQLGLVKLSNSDWEYINADADNEVVLSQAR